MGVKCCKRPQSSWLVRYWDFEGELYLLTIEVVESVREGERVRQKHVLTLGSIGSPDLELDKPGSYLLRMGQRVYFWGQIHKRLDKLEQSQP